MHAIMRLHLHRALPSSRTTGPRSAPQASATSLTAKGKTAATNQGNIDALIEQGLVQFDPIIYEDFLPVSAAGIFQSNLGDGAQQDFVASPNQQRFEADLGMKVLNEFDHYAGIEQASIDACLHALSKQDAAE